MHPVLYRHGPFVLYTHDFFTRALPEQTCTTTSPFHLFLAFDAFTGLPSLCYRDKTAAMKLTFKVCYSIVLIPPLSLTHLDKHLLTLHAPAGFEATKIRY